ncbi:glycosyltransferase family 4 protein [Rhodopirellula sp. JC639]|uniref:glycosyltransferase family 4 protein n=1 Tax=Stieleria mannarensis TaxID=2755585 RepID=UPI0016013A2E|nr:glycosyltransferase family 4 protein [Rhodopirellula sp. JC639]
MSGNHVVYGFLRPYALQTLPDHELVVLHYDDNPPPQELIQLGTQCIAISTRYRHWAKRAWWEATCLPRVIRDDGADLMLNVSGALAPRCPVPQVVLCQNPWCYRPIVHRSFSERFKARMQRIGYGQAFSQAALMIYISGHLRELYRNGNPGREEAASEIAYVGLNDATYRAAEQFKDLERDPFSILSVSAMASWKGAHTLVDAVGLLRKRDVPATLRLVGPWPDANYERQIREQVRSKRLDDAVEILGRVSDEELHRQYAINKVFALMSHCESYGIPSAEAMAFGTPVVSTDCCAISEICGPAGLFGPVEDPSWTADALESLLDDQTRWKQLSEKARERASGLTWGNCVQPLLSLPNLI